MKDIMEGSGIQLEGFVSVILSFFFGISGLFLAQLLFDSDPYCTKCGTIALAARVLIAGIILAILFFVITSKG